MNEKDKLWAEFEKHIINDGATKLRLNKLSTMFNIVYRYFDKPIHKQDREQIEQFITDLNKDKFRKLNGTAFSGSTKADIKKFLRQYFKWKAGDNEMYPKQVSWIKTRIPKDDQPKEKPVLNPDEVLRLANAFLRPEFRIITLLLFDSGFRIQEMLSVKKKDIEWDEYDRGKKCFWLSCNESKTEKRRIPIPLFTEDLKNFVNSSYFSTLNSEDFVFRFDYDTYRNALKNQSKKLFKKIITPHALRHSSATYYAKQYDGHFSLIAERYGWSFSSKQLRTYIRRSGAYQKLGAKKVYTNEVETLKEENKELKEKIDLLSHAFEKLTLRLGDKKFLQTYQKELKLVKS